MRCLTYQHILLARIKEMSNTSPTLLKRFMKLQFLLNNRVMTKNNIDNLNATRWLNTILIFLSSQWYIISSIFRYFKINLFIFRVFLKYYFGVLLLDYAVRIDIPSVFVSTTVFINVSWSIISSSPLRRLNVILWSVMDWMYALMFLVIPNSFS